MGSWDAAIGPELFKLKGKLYTVPDLDEADKRVAAVWGPCYRQGSCATWSWTQVGNERDESDERILIAEAWVRLRGEYAWKLRVKAKL